MDFFRHCASVGSRTCMSDSTNDCNMSGMYYILHFVGVNHFCFLYLGTSINHVVKFLRIFDPPPFVVTFTEQGLCDKMVIWLTRPPSP